MNPKSAEIRTETLEQCLACGGEGVPEFGDMGDRLYSVRGKWSYRKCPRDGHLWMSPRPIPDDNHLAYVEFPTHARTLPNRSALARLKNAMEDAAMAVYFGYGEKTVLRHLLARLPFSRGLAATKIMWLSAQAGGVLLDIGCGSGAFIEQMASLGWIVEGVEPDVNAAAIAARGNISCKIWPSYDDVGGEAGRFDAITSHHSIEHMHHPDAFLSRAFDLLRPGGRLVIVTPNVDGVGQRIFRRHWFPLDPPRHLHLFNPHTLASCAIKAGFEILGVQSSARSAWEIWVYSKFIRSHGAVPGGYPGIISPFARYSGFLYQLAESLAMIIFPRMGEALVVVARKPENNTALPVRLK